MTGLRSKQNSIGFKIGLGFSAIAIVLITALVMILIQLMHVNQLLTRVSTIEIPSVHIANQLLKQLNKSQALEQTWVTSQNQHVNDARVNLWNNTIIPEMTQLIKLADNDPGNAPKLKNLQTNIQLLKKMQDDFVSSATTITMLTDRNVSMPIITSQLQNINEKIKIYTDEHQAQLASNLDRMKIQLTTLLAVAIAFLVVAIILCALMALILTRSITRPIAALMRSTKELATGNLSEDITLAESAEFEELSLSLNHVILTLRNLASVTEKMAMGDYSQRVEVKSQNDQLAISINQMLANFNQIVTQANAIANGNYSTDIIPRSGIDTLGTSLQNMTQTLRLNKQQTDAQNWLKDGLANFANIIGETRDLVTLCNQAISEICRYTNAGSGTLYLYDNATEILQLVGTFAFQERAALHNQFKLGESLIGQAGLEKKPILLKKTADIFITSGTIEELAQTVYCLPILYEKSLIGVIEIAWNHDVQELVMHYLESLAPMLASHMQAAHQQKITEQLLHEQKLLAEKLQIQQEELKATNEELEQQAQTLRASEEELKAKDETQRAINSKLEEKTNELLQQKNQMENTNIALKQATEELKRKAEELILTSQYKSEFLANMSHELRTPLNSLIILAKLFADNKETNLNDDQIESAKIMLKSGNDLLTIINDILDLAKVEAGKIDIQLNEISLMEFLESTNRNFKHVTEQKNIDLITEIQPGLPDIIITDELRVSQVIRNLLSNAIKFTDMGHVKLSIERPTAEEIRHLPPAKHYLAFRVSDTGIGIPKEKQKLVFEAFQQADGTTSRRYGGTGLGLSISTQFAQLLKGTLLLESIENQGSTFTLVIPDNTDKLNKLSLADNNAVTYEKHEPTKKPEVQKQRALPILALISNETQQLALFKKLAENRYTLITITQVDKLFEQIKQTNLAGIVIDLDLKEIDSMALITRLKANAETVNIPLMVFGSLDDSPEAISHSVIGYLKKPFDENQLTNSLNLIQEKIHSPIRSLLIVEDDLSHLTAIRKLLTSNNLTIETAATGTEALYKMTHTDFDCVILDLGLPDMSGQEILKQYKKSDKQNHPAIIIYTGRDLSREDSEALNSYVDSIILKGSMASMDRLQQETAAFLQKVNPYSNDNITATEQMSADAIQYNNEKILVVDDDMRNVYALSRALKLSGLEVLMASNGKAALEMLDKTPDIQVVLMDIMMPIMDGYEAIAKIRQNPAFIKLPVIAITAKAMQGDKEKCMAIGASDFLTKPIDINNLLSVLQKWITPTSQ